MAKAPDKSHRQGTTLPQTAGMFKYESTSRPRPLEPQAEPSGTRLRLVGFVPVVADADVYYEGHVEGGGADHAEPDAVA